LLDHHQDLATLVEQAHNEHNPVNRAIIVSNVEMTGEVILKKWMKAKGKKI
jgi:hypothetical protein